MENRRDENRTKSKVRGELKSVSEMWKRYFHGEKEELVKCGGLTPNRGGPVLLQPSTALDPESHTLLVATCLYCTNTTVAVQLLSCLPQH